MRLILFLALMLSCSKAFSQEEAFFIEFDNSKLDDALDVIEDTYQIIFTYNPSSLTGKTLKLEGKQRTIESLLSDLNSETGLYFEPINARYISVKEEEDMLQYVNTLDLVVVKSYITKGIEKNNDGSYNINPQNLGILPGLTEPDVLESIQLLPGVLSPNETATGFFVRGGFSDQNRLVWDGINLYHKGHLFGMISPINPNVTSEIKFINKGTHPKYGERLSSVIDVTSKSEVDDTFNAEVGMNGLNLDALVDIPLVKNKLNLLASARTSYNGLVETPTFNQLSEKVFESTKIRENEDGNNAFYFNDYNLKLNYKPNANNSIFASFISIDNSLDYFLEDSTANKTFNDVLNISNTGYGAGWHKKWSDNLEHNVQAFFSDYALNYNFITAENAEEISNFEKRNTIFDSGISVDVDYTPSERYKFSFGYQYTLKDVAYAFINTSELTFLLDNEDRTVQSHSVYSNVGFSPKFVNMSFGLRSTYFKELDAVRLEPRLQLSKPLNKYFTLTATGEIKNQIINELDETVFSDLSLENNVWQLSDGDEVPIKNSLQTTLGFLYNKRSLSIDFDAYYRKLNDISALALGFLNPENSGFNIGNQRIYGIDVFLKKRLRKLNAWVSYSYNDARSTFENINDNRSFRSKSNVTHAVNTALSYKTNGFNFSLGWRWQTGRPFTVANTAGERLTFTEGVNTGRLPEYHRLDFSSTYTFSFSQQNRLKGKVGLSLRNLYNRRSLISREYRGNNNLTDPIEAIDRLSLGFTPNLMFRVFW